MQPVAYAAVVAIAATVLATSVLAQAPQTAGEVMKIDKSGARITLKHGEIRNLDMPAMTMVFRVADRAMLQAVRVGDRVRFAAERGGGAMTITRIEKAP